MDEPYVYYRWVIDYKTSDDEEMNGSTFGGKFDDADSARDTGVAFREHYSGYYPSFKNRNVVVERVTVEVVD